MNLTPEHLRASYEIYMKYGNSSSATILSVLNKLRESEGKEQVIACAFGPGIALEMILLRRRKEASSPMNSLETNGTNGVSHPNGATTHDGTADGNGLARTNGEAIITIEGAVIENGHPATAGTATEAFSSGSDEAFGNAAPFTNNSTTADGGNGSASSLPVEDLD